MQNKQSNIYYEVCLQKYIQKLRNWIKLTRSCVNKKRTVIFLSSLLNKAQSTRSIENVNINNKFIDIVDSNSDNSSFIDDCDFSDDKNIINKNQFALFVPPSAKYLNEMLYNAIQDINFTRKDLANKVIVNGM